MVENKKIHYIRQGREISREQAEAMDFVNKLSSGIEDEDERDSVRHRLNASVTMWTTNDQGEIVGITVDGKIITLEDD